MGRAVVGLAAVLVVSYVVWAGRSEWGAAHDVVPAYAMATLVQGVHLAEEYATGFQARFPPLFGAPPWSGRQFLAFNLVWLTVFVVAGFALRRGNRVAYLVALFLALGGGIANGLAHLALSALAGAYFPGAYSGVLALAAGAVLLRRLS